MSRQRSPHSDVSPPADQLQCSREPPKVPRTTVQRLSQDLQNEPLGTPGDPESDTVLYLAYGSNLCAETFLGKRGIRPLSQVNISAPTLRFTLSLPGVPYKEPCFANVDFRKLPDDSKFPGAPKVSPIHPEQYSGGKWDGGLMGVVYEVTREDYRQIMRTEGGGSGYKEIFIPCIPITPRFPASEKPPAPELPRPFLARTLCAPNLPGDGDPDDPQSGKWWRKFLTSPHRPDPEYSQASARYLKLITDGAKEHGLPDAYQEYLNSLQPYTITSWRQTVGQILLLGLVGPLLLLLMSVSKHFADEDGRYPPVLSATVTVLFNLTWVSYDYIFKPVFGDGERTEESSRKPRRLSIGRPQLDEEKTGLLEDED